MKKTTKAAITATPIVSAAAAAGAMYAYIKKSSEKALSKNLLKTEGGKFFNWSKGQLYYSVQGEGTPILLIHDVDPCASSTEWIFLRKELTTNHTIYTIDLPGCGRSCKPPIHYTIYLYVQMITEFIKNVIGQPVPVVASHLSGSFVIMAAHMNPELFKRLILINPVSIQILQDGPNKINQTMVPIYDTPFTGDFNYRLTYNPRFIENQFKEIYLETDEHVNKNLINIYYESAHLGDGNGKYLYSSLKNKYMTLDITHALPNIELPITIIGSSQIVESELNFDNYHSYNSNIKYQEIVSSALYPHMSRAEETAQVIRECLYN